MGKKNTRSRENMEPQRKRSRFQAIEVRRADEEHIPKKMDVSNKTEIEYKNKERIESLPLVKKTHKGEDNRTYEDKVQYALEEVTEELGLSDYEVSDMDSGIVRSRYRNVDISIEYLNL